MEEAQSSYCCVASAYVVLPRAAAAFAVVVRSSSSDRCAFIDDDVFPRLVRHLYNFMCSTRPCNSIIYAFVYVLFYNIMHLYNKRLYYVSIFFVYNCRTMMLYYCCKSIAPHGIINDVLRRCICKTSLSGGDTTSKKLFFGNLRYKNLI